MIYFEVRKLSDGNILSGNIQQYKNYLDYEKDKDQTNVNEMLKSRYQEFDNVSVWMIIVGEKDLYRSNNLLKRIMKAYGECADVLFPYYSKKINDHSHALRTIQSQMKQKIDGLARAKDFRGENYVESKNNIKNLIANDTLLTADTLCYLNKRVIEVEMHIGGFDILYSNNISSEDIKCKKVNIKKVLQNILAPFLESLAEQYITVSFNGLTDSYALHNQISLNYKIFHLAMYNFFNNVTKYTKQYSNIKIEFTRNNNNFEIRFDMMSYRIDKDEIEKIFQDGYCGRHASGCGDGIGMYVARKALNLINMNITVQPNYSNAENINGEQFVQNIFIINNILQNKN